MPDLVTTIENAAKTVGNVLSKDLQAIASAFESNPNLAAAGSTVVTDLKTAATATEAALPTLANAGVNYFLGLIGQGASAQLVDDFIDLGIAALTAAKSTPTS